MQNKNELLQSINFDILSLEGKYQTLYLEHRFHLRALFASILTLVGLNIWFETNLNDILFICFLFPIILLFYNGIEMISLKINLTFKEIEKLTKNVEKEDILSPLKKFSRIKNTFILLISGIILILNSLVYNFFLIENILILVLVLIFVIYSILSLFFEYLLGKVGTFYNLIKSLERFSEKKSQKNIFRKIRFNFTIYGFILFMPAIILLIIFIRNISIIDLKFINILIFVGVIAFISVMIYKSFENYYKMEDFKYYLKKYYNIKKKVSIGNYYIDPKIRNEYFLLNKYVPDLQKVI